MSGSQPASQQIKPVLEATTPDVRPFANIIRGVNFGNSTRATINLLKAGVNIVVEEARTLTAKAFIPCDMFETYKFTPVLEETDPDDPKVTFEIDLTALLTVLDIFGGAGSLPSAATSGGRGPKGKWTNRDDDDGEHIDLNGAHRGGGLDRYFHVVEKTGKLTGMRMTYLGKGHRLALTLSEDATGPVTTCNLSTMEPDEQMELGFEDKEKITYIIMKSSWLLEALSEVDGSCDTLSIICAPPAMPLPHTSTTQSSTQQPRVGTNKSVSGRDFGARPTFRLLAVSAYGSTEIDYPNDKEVLSHFDCHDTTRFSYRFSHIYHTFRALQGSTKTSLRMNEEGLMMMQMMMPTVKVRGEESATAIIEFCFLALDEEET